MKKSGTCAKVLRSVGIDTGILGSLRYLPRFVADVRRYRRAADGKALPISLKQLYPILHDYGDSAGTASGQYFHQDLWAARKIYRNRPPVHIDVGSRIDGFIAHLLPFMEVQVIDIRPLRSNIEGLHFIQDDATELKSFPTNSIPSLSSLHAAEHFGLGRYGDPIDPLGHLKFMSALERVVQPGGRLYFSVPMGVERLRFNADRILSFDSVLSGFPGLRLVDFSYVGDDGNLHHPGEILRPPANLYSGCGLFEFTKDKVQES
jgi:SAM-dependent methyltransferase